MECQSWRRGGDNNASVSSETELQSELQLARVEGASGLAEKRIVQANHLCAAQLEVGVIENVEGFCAELQT